MSSQRPTPRLPPIGRVATPAWTLGLAVIMLGASLAAPRLHFEHLDASADAVVAPPTATASPALARLEVAAAGRCRALARRDGPPDHATRSWHYQQCATAEVLSDDWSVTLRAPQPAQTTSAPSATRWIVDGVPAQCARGAPRCQLAGAPWDAARVRLVDDDGHDLAEPARIVWFQGRGVNLRRADLLRLLALVIVATGLVLTLRRLRQPHAGVRADLVYLAAGALAGALGAARPSAWGGASSWSAGALSLVTGMLLVACLRVTAPRARSGRALAPLVVLTTLLVIAFGDALAAARWPDAHMWQRAIVIASVLLTTFFVHERVGLRAAAVGVSFGLAAIGLDAFSAAPLPYAGLHGVFEPWDLVSAGLPWALFAPVLARLPSAGERAAPWTRAVADAVDALVDRLGRRETLGADARAELQAYAYQLDAGTLAFGNLATAGHAHTLLAALARSGGAAPQPPPLAGACGLLLLTTDHAAPALRGTITLRHEPRSRLLADELGLAVYDVGQPARAGTLAATGLVLATVDARLGLAHRTEQTRVDFAHAGRELVGRSFELPLALAWYAVRTQRALRVADLLATGQLGADRDTLVSVEGLARKVSALAPGEVLLVPAAQRDELTRAGDDIVVLAARRGLHRAVRRLQRAGRRVVVLTATLGDALRFAFGA